MYLNSKNIPEALKELSNSLERELAECKSKIDETIPKPQKYKALPKEQDYVIFGNGYKSINLSSYLSDMFIRHAYCSSDQIKDIKYLDERKTKILETVERFKIDCEKVMNENKEIKVHNDKIQEKVQLIMKELGVGYTYSTWNYKTSRSSRRVEQTHQAGYIGDLNRLIGSPPLSPIIFDRFKTNIENKYKEILSKIQEEELKEVKEKEKREKEHSFALMRAKYTPDNALSDYEDIRDKILEKDKYLHLAYWLEKNRGDWNEGYNYAEIGINNFVSENEEDKEIEKCILDLIESGRESGDIDGRVFRDCEYSYDFLYGKSDKNLFNDLQKLKEFDND